MNSGTHASARIALITGVAGQDGVYLSQLLAKKGYRVVGVTRRQVSAAHREAYLPGVEVFCLDIRDIDAFARLLDRVQPEEIYNLAAFSSVGDSWDLAETVAEVNGMSVLRLLEQILRFRERHGWAPKFYQASSSEMFGLADQQPQNERTAHHPRSPYGAAKSFAHNLAVNYRESYGLFVCSGVLFNHESPLRPDRFVTRKISKSVAEIALGHRDTMTLGNLNVKRDWGSASDYVLAMWLMMQEPEPDDFVVATGSSRPLSDVAREALKSVGLDDLARFLRSDPALQRPADVPELCGDASKAHDVLGWKPEHSFPEIITQMVWADIHRLRAKVAHSSKLLQPALLKPDIESLPIHNA